MKTQLFILTLVLPFLYLSTLSQADTDSANEPITTSGSSSIKARGKHGGNTQAHSLKAKKGAGTIRGTCTVMQSATNPIQGACVNLLLIVNDEQGNEVSRTRTSPQGQFEFSVEKGKAYQIVAGSKFYETVAPKKLVHGGQTINLQLQQK